MLDFFGNLLIAGSIVYLAIVMGRVRHVQPSAAEDWQPRVISLSPGPRRTPETDTPPVDVDEFSDSATKILEADAEDRAARFLGESLR